MFFVPPFLKGLGAGTFNAIQLDKTSGSNPPEGKMARVCTVTGKKPASGNKVSHANNRSRRRWVPNLQVCSFPSEILDSKVTLRLTANGIRTVEHNGGIDAWVMGTRKSRLSDEVLKVRKAMEKALARKAA